MLAGIPQDPNAPIQGALPGRWLPTRPPLTTGSGVTLCMLLVTAGGAEAIRTLEEALGFVDLLLADVCDRLQRDIWRGAVSRQGAP